MMHRCVIFINRALLLLFFTVAAAACGGNGNGREDVQTDTDADGQDANYTEDADVQDAELPVVPGTWVLVPSGVFMMGSPDSEPCREPWTTFLEKLHEVTLDRDIEMQAQFEEVMGYNRSTKYRQIFQAWNSRLPLLPASTTRGS